MGIIHMTLNFNDFKVTYLVKINHRFSKTKTSDIRNFFVLNYLVITL
ncbi:hypothetical protein SAMN06295967_103243 [Belliella buryatensis]|uniref:Uncharacterized protein n=1 Tax=Belliella buryatensis TaxID=1500549 RepID=A0A239BU34_9BACT|nr:hypothetical protein SAMN06295967_103243 [Belliella buryatensis]